ncbi:MAG: 3-dehydroquinate synthase [Piscirickettsiaceae bacterium]|nr:3-dehydroquinate synthase [Piscirickettsiaceae bacterium]
MTKTLSVQLGKRSYPIYIGHNLLLQPELIYRHITSIEVLIVTNKTIAPLYLQLVLNLLHNHRCKSVILPDGEQFKSLDILNQIFDQLLINNFSKQVTLIALGGGVIGDITGFAAACYQRGVPFIQIPTTLLSQVDSSIGGKTAVNHPLGKNMIGAFHHPKCVIADTNTLNTLNNRQLSSGLAEIIKYGLINDSKFFSWIKQNMPALRAKDPLILAKAIERACLNKANIVANDEFEHGTRILLNFGHTFGHAIETGMGYGNWLHGEAISCGMVMASDLSRRLGWLTIKDAKSISDLLKASGLPITTPQGMTVRQFMDLMSIDKKIKNNKIRLILLQGIGNAVISDDYPSDLLTATLKSFSH